MEGSECQMGIGGTVDIRQMQAEHKRPAQETKGSMEWQQKVGKTVHQINQICREETQVLQIPPSNGVH